MPTASQAARSVTGIAASVRSMKIDDQQRRAVENTRYAYVGAVVQTGRTARQTTKKAERPPRFGEIFKRISAKELHELMHDHPDANESIFQLDEGGAEDDAAGRRRSEGACQLGRPSSSHVVSVETTSDVEGVVTIDPFLLLDLRPVDAFNRAHIAKARSYSALDLRRDKMTVEITRFKMDERKPIIVYSDGEREATDIGTLLVQKHFPNVSVLSSSFEKYAFRFPDDIVGDVPKPPPKVEKKRQPLNVYVPKRDFAREPSSRAAGSVRAATTAASVVSSAPWRPV